MDTRSRRHSHRPGFRRHDEFGRHEVRGYGQQSQTSTPGVVSPFGNLPRHQAGPGGLSGQFTDPFSAAFGVGPGPGAGPGAQRRYADIMQQIQGDSPTAQYIRQAMQFLPQVFGQAQGVGSQIASLAPGIFNLLRGQIGNALGQLPGLESAASGATGQAQNAVNQAFSPIASQGLFQNALRGTLEASRAGAGARGLLDAGGQQGQEESLTRDLAGQYAQNQFANQQAALGGLQNAIGTQTGLLQAGPALAQAEAGALPGLQQALAAGYQTPMDAINAVFQQIAAYQNPQLALLGLTAPQVASRSQGGGFNVL